MTDERAYWLAWSQVSGIGATLLLRLYRHFGSLAIAWEASAQDLEAVEGFGEVTAASAVAGRSHLNPEALLAEHLQHNAHFWTPADPDYPRLLLEIPDPPPLLYYRGQVDLRENRGELPAIAIVGTRTPSNYGKRWTRRITQTLAKAGFTIVSGLAEGVDAEAHQACLEVGGRTIAVMGTGVNIAYPPKNRELAKQIDQAGLLLSEYPRGTQPDRVNFPRRNRIIAGLCRATLVLEAPERSGALITSRLANEYGREVFALPGSLDNAKSMGCLELLSKGAQMILGEEQLLNALSQLPRMDRPTPTAFPTLTEPNPFDAALPLLDLASLNLPTDLDQVYQVVTEEAIAFDQIVYHSSLPTDAILSALMQLELMGLVSQLPGMRYQRTVT